MPGLDLIGIYTQSYIIIWYNPLHLMEIKCLFIYLFFRGGGNRDRYFLGEEICLILHRILFLIDNQPCQVPFSRCNIKSGYIIRNNASIQSIERSLEPNSWEGPRNRLAGLHRDRLEKDQIHTCGPWVCTGARPSMCAWSTTTQVHALRIVVAVHHGSWGVVVQRGASMVCRTSRGLCMTQGQTYWSREIWRSHMI